MGKAIHLQKPFYLKSRSRDLGHALFGSCIIHCVVLVMAYPTKKKNEVCSFIHSKVMEGGVPKFKK